MDSQSESTAALFDVYLRLRPSLGSEDDQFLDVEPAVNDGWPKHITIRPPVNDNRKRAVEKFAFTRVFGEESSQLDIFHGTEVSQLITGVLGCEGRPRNGLLATLGVTGSGKVCGIRGFGERLTVRQSHTILGSKSHRGLTQMVLDVLFKSISHNMAHATYVNSVFPSLAASDVSDAQMMPASHFLDMLYGEGQSTRGSCSRAQTPMLVSGDRRTEGSH
jgi:Kinesin motor domain